MVELGSDVPLTKDILRKKPDFIKTETESLITTGTRILRRKVYIGTGSVFTMYTVPENRILFIVNASMNVVSDGTGTIGNFSGTRMFISSSNEENDIVSLAFRDNIITSLSKSINFSIPLIVESNETIKVVRTPLAMAEFQFLGYEISKALI